MTELPPEMLDPDAPPGTPIAEQSTAAPVWCAHGLRWTHLPEGYRCDDPTHHELPCVDAGAIPRPCQPVTAYDPAEFPHAGPGAVRRVMDELR